MRAIVFRGNDLLVMKRDKFGKKYATLPGGGMEIGEPVEHALLRELGEETGIQIGDARLVFIEHAGEPYGDQYIYLANYVGGEPQLDPRSVESSISQMGKNLYEPAWLPLSELAACEFISPKVKQAILGCVQRGFPAQPVDIS